MELERPLAAQIANPNQNVPYQSWGVTLAIDNPNNPSRHAVGPLFVRSSPAPLRTPFVAAQNNSTPVNRGTVFFECVAEPLLCGPPETASISATPRKNAARMGVLTHVALRLGNPSTQIQVPPLIASRAVYPG